MKDVNSRVQSVWANVWVGR